MTGRKPVVDFVHLGPARHGVRRYGELVEDAVSRSVPTGRWVRSDDGATGPLAAPATDELTAPVAHVQFSDHLVSVDDFEGVVRALRSARADRRIVATFHDCPGIGHDAAPLDTQRAATYAQAQAAVDAVIVCSDHERQGLQGVGVPGDIRVIAHLVEDRTAGGPPSPATARPTIAILGFIYPGKGHDWVIDACALVGRPVELLFLGGAATGHHDLVEELVVQARRRHVRCRVTGWLDEAQLGAWLVDTDVPVVAHRAPSASGSLATWLSAGRRPLVVDTPYARELDTQAPGALSLVDAADGSHGLARTIEAALDDPRSSRRTGPLDALGPAAIAAAHLQLYRGLP